MRFTTKLNLGEGLTTASDAVRQSAEDVEAIHRTAELQASIAYCRIHGQGRSDHKVQTLSPVCRGRASCPVKGVSHQQARLRRFTLDLAQDGLDSDHSNFRDCA